MFRSDFASTGRFRLLVLTSTDLLRADGRSARALEALARAIDRHPEGLIHLVVLHCLALNTRDVSWEELPVVIKKYAEMSFHSAWDGEAPVGKQNVNRGAYRAEDTYRTFGVSRDQGAVCVVRPDGYVGVVTSLDQADVASQYLETWLRPGHRQSNA